MASRIWCRVRRFGGLRRVGDVLAEVVDADAHAGAVDGLSDADGISDFGAGDEAAGNAATEALTLGESAQGTAFREADEECP